MHRNISTHLCSLVNKGETNEIKLGFTFTFMMEKSLRKDYENDRSFFGLIYSFMWIVQSQFIEQVMKYSIRYDVHA